MLNAGVLSFREFAMAERWPLATIHDAVLEFLRHRSDVVLFGAQAVNAYVDEPRMTQDIDVMCAGAEQLAEELCGFLRDRFGITVRVRSVAGGRELRIYQARTGGDRHLVDVRPVAVLPTSREVDGVRILAPPELVASKVLAFHARRGQPKSGTDWRDLAMLLLTFPHLKQEQGAVLGCLRRQAAPPDALGVWREIVNQEILPAVDDDAY